MASKKGNTSKTKSKGIISRSGNPGKSDVDIGSNKIGSNKANFETIAAYYDLPRENLTPGIVLHKISEVLELYLKLIQQVLQPEEFHSLHECAVFDDLEKSKLFDLYSRIIILHRELLKAIILNEEKNSISTMKYVHSEVLAVKPMMLDILNKMQHSWKIDINKESKTRAMQHYFG